MLEAINVISLSMSAGTLYLAFVVVALCLPDLRGGIKTYTPSKVARLGMATSFLALIATSTWWNIGFAADHYHLAVITDFIFKWGQLANILTRHGPYTVSAMLYLTAIMMMIGIFSRQRLFNHFIIAGAITVMAAIVLLATAP